MPKNRKPKFDLSQWFLIEEPKFWQFANKNIFGKTKKQKNIESLVEGNIKITDKAIIAHSMNTFYANVGKNLNKKKKRKKTVNQPITDTSTNSLFLNQLTLLR